MTLRDDLLAVMAEIARQIPQDRGFRPYTFKIVTRTWPGKPGDPGTTPTDVELVISPTPKIKDITSEDAATSGGAHEIGTIRVGPITPQYSGGGYTEAQLAPRSPNNRTEILYVVTGTRAGTYRLVRFTKASLGGDPRGRSELGYHLLLTRINRTP